MCNQLEAGFWADPDYFLCPCRGGWFLSAFDTSHRCPYHAEGDGHPEDEEEETEEERLLAETYKVRMARKTFRHYDRSARDLGIQHFRDKVSQLAYEGTDNPDPKAFCEAAARVVAAKASRVDRDSARHQGYSCAFELRMADEGMWERKEQGRF